MMALHTPVMILLIDDEPSIVRTGPAPPPGWLHGGDRGPLAGTPSPSSTGSPMTSSSRVVPRSQGGLIPLSSVGDTV